MLPIMEKKIPINIRSVGQYILHIDCRGMSVPKSGFDRISWMLSLIDSITKVKMLHSGAAYKAAFTTFE